MFWALTSLHNITDHIFTITVFMKYGGTLTIFHIAVSVAQWNNILQKEIYQFYSIFY